MTPRIFILTILIFPWQNIISAQKPNDSLLIGSWKLIGSGKNGDVALPNWSFEILSFYSDYTYQSKSKTGIPHEHLISNKIDSMILEAGKWTSLVSRRALYFNYTHRIPNVPMPFEDKECTVILVNDTSLVLQFGSYDIQHFKKISHQTRAADNYSSRQLDFRDIYILNSVDPKRKVKIKGLAGPIFSLVLSTNISDTLITSSTKYLDAFLEQSSDTSLICTIYKERDVINYINGTTSDCSNDYFILETGSKSAGYSLVKRTIYFKDINYLNYSMGWRTKTYKLTTKQGKADKNLWYLHKPIEQN